VTSAFDFVGNQVSTLWKRENALTRLAALNVVVTVGNISKTAIDSPTGENTQETV
jgi:hypothetical protein